MGGDADQPQSYVGSAPPAETISLNARGHGPSDGVDAVDATFDRYADDVISMADHLRLERFVVGGISLGAATALNLAVRHPDRVTGLVLCRPAWLDRPQDDGNRAAYAELADLLDHLPRDEAIAAYRDSHTYRAVRAVSPAAAASLLGQLTRPRAAQNSVILRAFPSSSPTTSTEPWRRIAVPTLVIGHHDDPYHPYAMAAAYAETIPGARLVTVPSKDADPTAFGDEIRTALHVFLREVSTL